MATAQVAVNGNSSPKVTNTSDVAITNNGVKTETLYIKASDVLADIPKPMLENLTWLTKRDRKFRDICDGANDQQMNGFRMQYLNQLIGNLAKTTRKAVNERLEKDQRDMYKEYRSRGIDKAAAIKLSGYNPDLE